MQQWQIDGARVDGVGTGLCTRYVACEVHVNDRSMTSFAKSMQCHRQLSEIVEHK